VSAVTPRRVFVAALLAWSAIVIAALVVDSPLHGDEAAYAVLARTGADEWLYRSRGVVALARLGLALGGSDVAVRLTGTVLGLGVVVAAAAAGRALARASGRSADHADRVAAWTAAAIAGSHPFALRGAELLGDVPAAAALLGAIALAIAELSRTDGPRYRLVAAAPLCAAAFYLRYGNVLVIAAIAACSLATWWRGVRARPAPVIATAVALGVLALPFVAMSRAATGSPIAILMLGNTVANRAASYPGAGIVEYLTRDPFELYGALTFVLVVVALVALVRGPRSRAGNYVAVIAGLQIIAVGAVTHAEGRYVYVATALLVAIGVDAIAPRLAPGSRAAGFAGVAAAVAALACAIATAISQGRIPRDAQAHGIAIRDDAAGRPCVVFALAVPQVEWYSGCDGAKWEPPDPPPPVAADMLGYAADVTGFGPLDIAKLAAATGTTALAIAPGAWRLAR
jgi:hypothetical protein